MKLSSKISSLIISPFCMETLQIFDDYYHALSLS